MTRRTILKGPFVMEQDITKSDEYVWTPTNVGSDGDPVPYNGTETPFFILLSKGTTGAPVTYETRDARTVVRLRYDKTSSYVPSELLCSFRETPLRAPITFGIGTEIRATFYQKGIGCGHRIPYEFGGVGLFLDTRTSPSVLLVPNQGFLRDPNTGQGQFQKDLDFGITWDSVDDLWLEIGLRIDTDGKTYLMLKPEADPDVWELGHDSLRWMEERAQSPKPYMLSVVAHYPTPADSYVDLWKFQWRRL